MSSKFTLLFSVFATFFATFFATLRFTSLRARLEYAKMAATFTTDSSVEQVRKLASISIHCHLV